MKQAYENNPQIEQAVLTMSNNKITIKAFKNGLLPTVDALWVLRWFGPGRSAEPGAAVHGRNGYVGYRVPSERRHTKLASGILAVVQQLLS